MGESGQLCRQCLQPLLSWHRPERARLCPAQGQTPSPSLDTITRSFFFFFEC